MKPEINEQILRDVEALPEEAKHQVIAFIRSLGNAGARVSTASRLRVLDDMNQLAAEIGKHWQEDADAADLVSSMRR